MRRIGDVEGATLQNVDIYEVPLTDLQRLAKASVVVPWLTTRRRARGRENAAIHPTYGPRRDPAVVRWERAEFWAQLSTLLADKHAPGAVRSEARYAAHQARHLAIPRGREHALLAFYGPLGYGERIGRPLGALGLLAALGAVWISGSENFRGIAHTFISLLGAPLSFFGFTDLRKALPTASGPIDGIVLLAVQVLGLLFLVLALVAARRVLRAE